MATPGPAKVGRCRRCGTVATLKHLPKFERHRAGNGPMLTSNQLPRDADEMLVLRHSGARRRPASERFPRREFINMALPRIDRPRPYAEH